MKPGIYYDLSYAEYDAIDAVRASHAKHALDSPADYLAATTEPSRDTAALKRGHAIHTAILEPLKFLDDYVLYEASKTKGEGAVKAWKAFQAANADKCILTPEEYGDAKAAAAAVKASPACSALMRQSGRAEASIVWNDPATSLLCKARLDWLTDTHYPDVKSTRSARDFLRQARGYRQRQDGEWRLGYGACGYDFQAEFHRRGLEALGMARSPAWIVVQTTSPIKACLRRPDATLCALGRQQVDAALDIIADCTAKGEWPWLDDEATVEAETWETDEPELLGVGEEAA